MIKITGTELVLQNLSKTLKENVERAKMAMENVSEDLVSEIYQKMDEENLVDTGLTQKSIKQKTDQKKNQIVSNVFSNELSAFYLEFGRKGGKAPPLSALQGWAVRHGFPRVLRVNDKIDDEKLKQAYIILNNAKKGGGKGGSEKKGKQKPIEPIILDLMSLISLQRFIGKNGRKGKYVFTRVLQEFEPKFQEKFISYFSL